MGVGVREGCGNLYDTKPLETQRPSVRGSLNKPWYTQTTEKYATVLEKVKEALYVFT